MKAMRLALVFFAAATFTFSAPGGPPQIDTRVVGIGQTITTEELLQFPLTRNGSSLILGPITRVELDLPAETRVTAAGQVEDDARKEFDVMIKAFVHDDAKAFLCRLTGDCSPVSAGKLSACPSFGVAQTPTSVYADMVIRGTTAEYNKAGTFDIKWTRVQSGYPVFPPPEKLFPVGTIGSVGLAGDGSAFFQLPNFGTNPASQGYFLFRAASNFKPEGPIYKRELDGLFLGSGTLSNLIPGTTPSYYFGYREFKGAGANMTSQVKVQILDADTFLPIGPPAVYTPPTKLFFSDELEMLLDQSVAIEPQGSFLVYSQHSSACNKDLMYARKINPNGSPGGPPKLLTSCGMSAADKYGWAALNVVDVQH